MQSKGINYQLKSNHDGIELRSIGSKYHLLEFFFTKVFPIMTISLC